MARTKPLSEIWFARSDGLISFCPLTVHLGVHLTKTLSYGVSSQIARWLKPLATQVQALPSQGFLLGTRETHSTYTSWDTIGVQRIEASRVESLVENDHARAIVRDDRAPRAITVDEENDSAAKRIKSELFMRDLDQHLKETSEVNRINRGVDHVARRRSHRAQRQCA
jgi:hypothetical protein